VSADGVNSPRRMLRIKEASTVLDIPESTLRRLCAKGKVPAKKVGRAWRVKGAYVDDATTWESEAAS
jgi:excisionase family DNA binding protein